MKKVISIIAIIFIYATVFSQTDTTIYYLDESFENTPRNWQSLPSHQDIKWTYQNGGHELNPYSAFHGEYNAYFYWASAESQIRDLVSAPIDLSSAVKPRLTFYHTQAESDWGTDHLRLLFRTSPIAPWDTIVTYLSPVSLWTRRSFNIDQEGEKYLTGQFYLAFSGTSNAGHGICIDSVKIVETAVITRYVNNITVNDIVHSVIPSGARAIPVFRINIEVLGNTGNLTLDSVNIKSLCTDNSVFEANGFQLFYTQNEIFRNETKDVSTKIGSSVSVSNGYIRFGNLNTTLKTGIHYLWLAADVKPGDIHNQQVDFVLETNSVTVSNKKYPFSDASAPGVNVIEEAVFYDNFATDKGWTLEEDFEIDVPKGKFVIRSNDPDYAYSGTKVLGNDHNDLGDYLVNIDSATAYFATTPSMNLKYFDRIKLSMMKWISFEPQDEASIDISIDGGSTWTKLWSSQVSGQNPESAWNSLSFSSAVNNLAKRKEDVKFRFAINFSDNNNAYAGWNIDNFAVTGEYLTNEVGITQVILPCDDCLNTSFDSVKVVVRNYAAVPSAPNLPVFFSLDGNTGTRIYDTIKASIPVDDSIIYTFRTPANFPGPGSYNFLCATDKSGDQDRTNDSVYLQLKIQDNINPPSIVDFETAEGYWISNGVANTWICKIPDESIGPIPGSPNAWILSPFGLYADNDSSYLESSCYDLTGINQLVLEMKYTNISQTGHDGANVQYTTNNGTTWSVLENNSFGYDWNWYTTPVSALGQNGWTGSSDGWKTAKTMLPATLQSEPRVKFRILWMSDSDPTESSRGIALDDFSIYPAPPDLGVFSIDSPTDDCLNEVSDQVTVTVKNYGFNKVNAGDTILMGYIFDGNETVYDTLLLETTLDPGNTTQFTFAEKISTETDGLYQLSAFTLFEDDPWFYGSNNDSSTTIFQAYPLPLTNLPDTIQSREPDTVVIRSYYDINYDYSWKDTLGVELSTADTLKVPGDGWYYLHVTNAGGNGCYNYDSVYVELLYFDVGMDTIISPVSSCELSDNEQIQVRIKNFGTDSIVSNSKIAVSYIYNGAPAVTDTLLLTTPLQSGETRLFTFTGKYEDFSEVGLHAIKLFTYFGGDTVRGNDTLNLNVEVYGYPVVNIGGDQVVEALTYPLDAGPGYISYLWEDGDSVQVHIADETGLYHVTATDIHGCPGYDTAFIRLKIRDVSPDALLSPLSACNLLGNVNVQIQARNTGNDTIPAGSKVYFRYKLDSQPVRNDSLTLTSPVFPGGTMNRTFSYVENLNTYGEYAFMIFANTINDLNPANDTLYDTIYLQTRPVVDFGLDDIYTHKGLNYMLDAGYGESLSYLWQDGATNQTYDVTKSGIYNVKVTDDRTGCYAKDSVTIFLIITDVGVTAVNLPMDSCSGSFSNVQVQIKNLGNSSIAAGETIRVAYELNNTPVGESAFELTNVFAFGSNIYRNLTDTINIPDGVHATLRFYTNYSEDLRPENDTLTMDYGLVRKSPEVDFGDIAGVLMTDLPHLLVPEQGHPSYLWQDNSTSSTYNVTQYGNYSVTVTSTNGCKTSKTVKVTFITGIDDPEQNPFNLRVYPNPARDFLNLEMDITETNDVIIEFYNSEGRVIMNDKGHKGSKYARTLNISSLKGGIYYIKIFNADVLQVNKVVVY
ncbi:MAG: T9SS type A sorting domain-containing protein [Bacteroidales bacterium]|nr:T9SS type A sorting domain-containing protein [Bacteroidales bacterium]